MLRILAGFVWAAKQSPLCLLIVFDSCRVNAPVIVHFIGQKAPIIERNALLTSSQATFET